MKTGIGIFTVFVSILICGCRDTKIWDPPPPKPTHSEKPVEKAKEKSGPLTARDYFVELRDLNTFDKYYDKYACFNDTDEPWFTVMSTAKDMRDAMTRSGNAKNAKVFAKMEGILVQTYYKGVASNAEPDFYHQIAEGHYSLNFDAKTSIRQQVYAINWRTGRFRSQMFSRNSSIPAVEVSGKCELIHRGDTPSVAGDDQ
jgi:hypothetical protein